MLLAMPGRTLNPYSNKIYFFVLTTLLFAVLVFNLFSIQIVKGSQFYFNSKNLYSGEAVIRASRGLIYDRNGVKLVDNELKYNLYILRDTTKENYESLLQTTITNLDSLLKENTGEKLSKLLERYKSFNISEIKLYSRIDYNPYVFQIEANPSKYPVLRIEKTNVRKYLYPELTSHLLGYTGEITEEDYRTGKYNFGDEIGKFGIEKGYDQILRGKNGRERIEVDLNENRSSVSVIQDKVNGDDIYLSIDISYQKKLYELTKTTLEKEGLKDAISSATVIQDVNNGEVLAMVSYPNFDSNLFVNGISNADYNKYISDPGKPLSNKAIQYSQSPGSIIKPLTSAVALQKGAINKNSIYTTGGTFEFGGVTFQDVDRKNFGDVNVVQGLCVSSNIYQMKSVLDLDKVTGGRAADTLAEYFNRIGLNKPTELNLGSESVGYFPTPKDKVSKGQVWLPGYLLNSSIGQGEVRMTPLGATALASTIANNGKVFKPQIIKQDEKKATPQAELGIAASHLQTVKDGMLCAANKDNSITQYNPKSHVEVSEKTGTAETGQIVNGKSVIHGWEISFAPSTKPEIAMSVFIENGKHGYNGGYISREFYKYWSESKGVAGKKI